MSGWDDLPVNNSYAMSTNRSDDDIARICARTFNRAINLLTEYSQHTVPELRESRFELGCIRSLCENDDFSINLGADNSNLFQGLNKLGVRSDSLRVNSERFFPSISSKVMTNVIDSISSVLEFVIDLNHSGFSTLWVGEIMTIYDATSFEKLVDAIYRFLAYTYNFPEEVQFHMTLNLFNDDILKILNKAKRKLRPLTDSERIAMAKSITKGLHFEFHFTYRSLGLYLPKVTNSITICNKNR
uniref:p28 n=1 Tax=Sweet potato chlorotic stunt virus TaxID=81931 RepID=S5W8Z8_9CLOS|nr:p28 [Sweet potato chlorotic stunt virus]